MPNADENFQAPNNEFTATHCSMAKDGDYLIRFCFSCGSRDGLVFVTMTRKDFQRDFIEPLQRRLEA